MRTILYARVSTADQTIAHQRTHAEVAGFKIDEVVSDDGGSGVSTKLADRVGGARLFDKLRSGDVLVVRWVDRLGRNYDDAVASIRRFMDMGVIVKTVINGMTFDGATADPIQKAVRDALIGFMTATAQAQAEATKAAQKAGIAHAKDADANSYRGRKPSFTHTHVQTVADMTTMQAGVSAIAAATGLSRQTVYRIQANPAAAVAMLANWGAAA